MYDRATVIQRTLAAVDGHTYLEIGAGWPDTFLAVKAHEKVGIDPRQPSQLIMDAAAEAISRTVNLPERSTCIEIGTSDEASFLAVRALPHAANGQLAAGETTPSVFETSLRYFQLTSDQFFASQAHFLASRKIDVAFVDGLHEWRQVERDVMNCLEHLAPGGVIVLHDCLPVSAASATPVDRLASLKPPADWTGEWMGDVWKTIAYLRSSQDTLRIFVLDCDCGLGIVTRGRPDSMLGYTPTRLATMGYEDLVADRERILNLKPAEYFDGFLEGLRTRRASAVGRRRVPVDGRSAA